MKEKKETGNEFIILNGYRFDNVAADAMTEIVRKLDEAAIEHDEFDPMLSIAHTMLLSMFAAKIRGALFNDDTAHVETSGIDTSDLTDDELNEHNTYDEFTL